MGSSKMISQEENPTGIVAFIDLPAGSSISLDGESVQIKRDDFVGFRGVATTGENDFHLVTVRAAKESAITVGFILDEHSSLIRWYDKSTEEMGSQAVDDITAHNLVSRIQQNLIEPERIVDYNQFIDATKSEKWKTLTHFISESLLNRRQIKRLEKLVPGSYESEQQDSFDGKNVAYPPIPVIPLSGQRNIRHIQHAGTKRFLESLHPSQRTLLCTAPPSQVLEHLLSHYYNGKIYDLLGDLQLSFVLFLYMHCFSSLSHWRDLIAMLSVVETEGVCQHDTLYASIVRLLYVQLQFLDDDFIDDEELSGDSFLVPTLQKLMGTVLEASRNSVLLAAASATVSNLLSQKFPNHFSSKIQDEYGNNQISMSMDYKNEDDDTDEGPVVVELEEVEASIHRSEQQLQHRRQTNDNQEYNHLRDRYPLLFAAMQPDAEDVLMTCARVLDAANDVSLVREAAAYLEEVEAKRKLD
jgi:A1 cistron-splicing factor AAR2